jgi:uncharacterized membrane protein YidH (DUF202 family)
MALTHDDLGLQPERTLLAWRRTLLSLMGVGALFLRWIPEHGPLAICLTSTALLAIGGIWLGQWRRYRVSIQGINANLTQAPLGEIIALGLACCLIGALGLYVVLRF